MKRLLAMAQELDATPMPPIDHHRLHVFEYYHQGERPGGNRTASHPSGLQLVSGGVVVLCDSRHLSGARTAVFSMRIDTGYHNTAFYIHLHTRGIMNGGAPILTDIAFVDHSVTTRCDVRVPIQAPDGRRRV